eukprot:110502-Heterocapsa_arctica.AAC.1
MRALQEGLQALPQEVRDNVNRTFNEAIAADAVNIDDPAYPGVFRAAIQRTLAMLDDNDNDDGPDFDPADYEDHQEEVDERGNAYDLADDGSPEFAARWAA